MISEAENRNPKSDIASLVIPAYNERKRIEGCLRSVADWVRSRPGGWEWEVILVDDGSTDGTKGIARRLAAELGLTRRSSATGEPRQGVRSSRRVLASRGDPVLVSTWTSPLP